MYDTWVSIAAERGKCCTQCRLCCRRYINNDQRSPTLPPATSLNMSQQRRTAVPHTRQGCDGQTGKTCLTSTMCRRADGISSFAKRTPLLLVMLLMALDPSQLLQPALAFVQPLLPVVVGKGRLSSRSTASASKVIVMSERRGLWPTRPPIDLRSDTVTVPTAGMRKAMNKVHFYVFCCARYSDVFVYCTDYRRDTAVVRRGVVLVPLLQVSCVHFVRWLS